MSTALCVAIAANETTLRATATREDTKVTITATEQTTHVSIVCPFGIDRTTLERTSDAWPSQIVVRLQLKGLESCEVASGPVSLQVSVPSTGEPKPRLSLRENGKESELDQSSPYWTEVRLVGGNGKIPLENGHFEISLPKKLFEGNPASIQLHWIDFYRN